MLYQLSYSRSMTYTSRRQPGAEMGPTWNSEIVARAKGSGTGSDGFARAQVVNPLLHSPYQVRRRDVPACTAVVGPARKDRSVSKCSVNHRVRSSSPVWGARPYAGRNFGFVVNRGVAEFAPNPGFAHFSPRASRYASPQLDSLALSIPRERGDCLGHCRGKRIDGRLAMGTPDVMGENPRNIRAMSGLDDPGGLPNSLAYYREGVFPSRDGYVRGHRGYLGNDSSSTEKPNAWPCVPLR